MMLLLACMPDDYDPNARYDDTAESDADVDTDTDTDADTDTDTDTDTDADTIVGGWVSEGADLSELLAPYYTSLEAHFESSGSYTAAAVDTDGATTSLSGTYTVGTSTSPCSIVLSQTSPANATSEGIYEVDGDSMTYEVVLVDPDYGYSPPTPESGFGTTSGPQIEPGVNIQTYRRTE